MEVRDRPARVRHARRGLLLLVGGAVAGYALGPRASMESRWVPSGARAEAVHDVADEVWRSERAVADVRPGDHAEVVWADPDAPRRTPVSLVYLHGFSADRHEIEPVVSRVATAVGANVFFTRLRGHGRDGEAMAGVAAEEWLDDVARAFTVGSSIGERVVLVGTSTGGTLATWAATREETRAALAAVVLLSPNFHPRDRTSRVLLWPWGGAIARAVVGPERCFTPLNPAQEAHWTTCYPVRALLPMMALVETVRTMDVSSIAVPTLVVYSPDDQVVDARETERVVARMVGAEVRSVAFAGSEEPAAHVPGGEIVSPGTTDEVVEMLVDFLTDTGVAEAAGGGET